jgi:hypothetical protein
VHVPPPAHRAAAAAPWTHPLPPPWQQQLGGSFTRLLLVRLLRRQCFVPAAAQFVAQHLGSAFTDPDVWTLDEAFEDSSSSTPIVFILSPGACGAAGRCRQRSSHLPGEASPACLQQLLAHTHTHARAPNAAIMQQ